MCSLPFFPISVNRTTFILHCPWQYVKSSLVVFISYPKSSHLLRPTIKIYSGYNITPPPLVPHEQNHHNSYLDYCNSLPIYLHVLTFEILVYFSYNSQRNITTSLFLNNPKASSKTQNKNPRVIRSYLMPFALYTPVMLATLFLLKYNYFPSPELYTCCYSAWITLPEIFAHSPSLRLGFLLFILFRFVFICSFCFGMPCPLRPFF